MVHIVIFAYGLYFSIPTVYIILLACEWPVLTNWYNWIYQKEPDGIFKISNSKDKDDVEKIKNALVPDAALGCTKSGITASYQNLVMPTSFC